MSKNHKNGQKSGLNRRQFMTQSTLGAMALGTSGLWAPRVFGAEETAPSKVLAIFLPGGCDGTRLFANTLLATGTGAFGVTPTSGVALNPTETDPANKVTVDVMFNQLNPFAKSHFGVVGVAHGITAHGPAKAAHFTAAGKSGILSLASAMGGSGSIKCAAVGAELPFGPTAAVGGVTIQQINDMQSTIDALGGGVPDPTMPGRDLAAAGIAGSLAMSAETFQGNPDSMITVASGYKVAQETLKKPKQAFNPEELKAAYNLTSTAVTSMMAKMAAAELMFASGTNVVTIVDGGGAQWDTHGDTTGARARGAFQTRILPALKLFTDRNITETAPFNIHVMIFGDFNRSAPGSDHAGTSSVAVIGPRIKQGSTGNVDAQIRLPAGTAGTDGLWGLMGHLSGGPSVATAVVPAGNPHTRLVKA